MATITVSKKLAQRDDIVSIPRREYEALLELKKLKEFVPTSAQKKALEKAEKRFKQGKTLSYSALIQKLGFAD